MTNASMPTSSSSCSPQEEQPSNNNNHQGFNISLPPPDQTSTLCANGKVKTTVDMRKESAVTTITESFS